MLPLHQKPITGNIPAYLTHRWVGVNGEIRTHAAHRRSDGFADRGLNPLDYVHISTISIGSPYIPNSWVREHPRRHFISKRTQPV